MNVALPEIDGRILSRAVSFKAPLGRDPETEADLVGYRPVADRIAFVADLARNWARLRAKPAAERRVAIVLANYPNRDGRIGNGVGLDTPASAVAILQALRDAGYRTGDMPEDGAALMQLLLAGPSNARPHAPAEETLSVRRVSAFFASLPQPVQQQVSRALGQRPSATRSSSGRLDCGRFRDPRLPRRQHRGADPAGARLQPRPEGDLSRPGAGAAAFLFCRLCLARRQLPRRRGDRSRQARHARMAAGQGAGLSAECFPEVALGPLPHLYPFIVNDPGEGSQAKRRAQAVIVDHLTPPLTRPAATVRRPNSSG